MQMLIYYGPTPIAPRQRPQQHPTTETQSCIWVKVSRCITQLRFPVALFGSGTTRERCPAALAGPVSTSVKKAYSVPCRPMPGSSLRN